MTGRPVRFRRAAQRELAAAVAWYDEQLDGLGTDLLGEVAGVVGRIGSMPMQFPVVHRDVRRALLQQFPYALYFKIEPQVITVFAILHQRRDPREWKGR